MKHWFNTHYKTLIVAAFLIPIITVAIVSISHVTQWYGISNPVSWAIYLSIGIEIAALSALAAISANMGKKVYFPFAIVTLVQFIGNIFFAYSYIDIASKSFQDWVGLVSPLLELTGVEPNDMVGHKRFLAFFAGGMLPIISLSFLHMLVKFTEEDRANEIKEESKPVEPTQTIEQLKDFVDETTRLHLSENDLKKLEEVLLNPPPPNEKLKEAAEEYERRGEILKEIIKNDEELGLYDEPFDNPLIKETKDEKWNGISQEVWDRMEAIEKQREAIHGPITEEDLPTGALANSGIKEKLWADEFYKEEEPYAGPPSIFPKEVEYTDEYNKPLYENPVPTQTIVEPQIDLELAEDDISDWDATLMDGLEDEEPFFTEDEIEKIIQEEPTEEEIQQNFSTIEPETENIFQDNVNETLVPEEVISNLLNELIEDVDNQELRTEEQVPELFTMPEEVETFKIDVRAINETLNEVNDAIDTEEDDLKKKDELEVTPSNEIVEIPTPTPTPTETQLNQDTDSLYWESGENPIPLVDEDSPTQVTYEDNTNDSPIEESEQFNPFGAFFPKAGSKIIPRNVRNTKRRGFR